jgi:hypothetical protein
LDEEDDGTGRRLMAAVAFFFRPFPAGCPELIPGFFFPPFSGGLPRVNTSSFFSFFFSLFQRAAQN